MSIMYHARQRPVPIIAVVAYLHSEALELKYSRRGLLFVGSRALTLSFE